MIWFQSKQRFRVTVIIESDLTWKDEIPGWVETQFANCLRRTRAWWRRWRRQLSTYRDRSRNRRRTPGQTSDIAPSATTKIHKSVLVRIFYSTFSCPQCVVMTVPGLFKIKTNFCHRCTKGARFGRFCDHSILT